MRTRPPTVAELLGPGTGVWAAVVFVNTKRETFCEPPRLYPCQRKHSGRAFRSLTAVAAFCNHVGSWCRPVAMVPLGELGLGSDDADQDATEGAASDDDTFQDDLDGFVVDSVSEASVPWDLLAEQREEDDEDEWAGFLRNMGWMGDDDDEDFAAGAGPAAAPEGAAPEGAAPEGAAPEGAAPEGAAPEGAAPEGVATWWVLDPLRKQPDDGVDNFDAAQASKEILQQYPAALASFDLSAAPLPQAVEDALVAAGAPRPVAVADLQEKHNARGPTLDDLVVAMQRDLADSPPEFRVYQKRVNRHMVTESAALLTLLCASEYDAQLFRRFCLLAGWHSPPLGSTA
jgi:hypothetical protein